MKKAYTKPWVIVESFELTEHIASICTTSGHANHQTVETCGFYTGETGGNTAIFVNTEKCNYNPYPEDEDISTQFECYYVAFTADGMFSS